MIPRQDDSRPIGLLRSRNATGTLFDMTNQPTVLPDDIDALRALIEAERAAHAVVLVERNQLAARNAKLEHMLVEIRRAHFGRKVV